MKNRLLSLIGLVLVFSLVALPAQAQDVVPTNSPATGLAEHVPDEVLIRFSPGLGAAQSAEKMAAMGVLHRREISDLGVHLVKLPPGLSVEQALERFSRMPGVEFVEPNYILRIAADPPVEVVDQWALNKIHAPQAWEFLGAGEKNEVLIATVDTGIDKDRPDLNSRIWYFPDEIPDNGIDDDGNGYIDDSWGWDFVNNDNDPIDDNMHGTAVSGVMVAAKDDAGVAGVCPWCRVIAVKVINSQGSGTLDVVANGITYAADNGARVINLSLGATAGAQTLEAAVNYAWEAGSLVVAAAGNNGTETTFYPAGYANAMAVASTNAEDKHSCFSNFGEGYISVAAPGEAVVVIDINNTETGYGTYSGTSLSTPHVSGLAGLLLGQNPALTNADVRTIIEDSAVDLGSAGIDGVFGHGRIDAYRAVTGDISQITPPDSLSSNSDSATGFPHARKLVRDSSGVLHVIWHTYDSSLYRIRYATSSDNGVSWDLQPDVFSSPYESYHPALAVDDSNLYVVIPTRIGDGQPYQVVFTWKSLAGGDWSSAEPIISGSFDAVRPDIFFDPTNGRLNVIASSYDNSADLYYRSSDTLGATWNTLRQFSIPAAYGLPNLTRYAAIYAHGDNVYVVTRTVQSLMGFALYLNMWTVRSTDGGQNWIEKTQIAAFMPVETSEYGISLAGVGDRIYMAYEYGTGIYFRRNDGAGWSDYLNLETGTSSNVYKWPSITQSADGQAWMLFELSGQLYKRYYDGTTWQAKELVGKGTFPNLKLGTESDRVEWVYTICNGSPFDIAYGSFGLLQNSPPQADDQNVTTNEDTPVNITLTASDPDDDPLTYSLLSNPTHGALTGSPPSLTYTPTGGYFGPDSFTFKANDGKLDSNVATVSITVNPSNHPPNAVNDSAQTLEGTPVIVSVLANDTDPDGDSLTISDLGTPFHGTAEISDGGTTVTYTPVPAYYGSDSFYYTITDGHGATDSASVFVSVTQKVYSLAIEISGNGTVTANPSAAHYHYGDVVALTATPAMGWTFAGWSANVIDGKVTIYGDTTVTATFTQNEYSLTIDIVGNGTVTANPSAAHYHYGDVVALSATPAAGWNFVGWSANVIDGNVTIYADTTVTATFSQYVYYLAIVSTNGVVTKFPDQTEYHYGDEVLLTSIPDPGWRFTEWSGDLNSTQNPVTVTIDSNKSIVANYAVDTLIFKDSFASCNASAWSSTVNPSALSFTSAAAWDQPCGMAVTVSSNSASYVRDNTPGNESRYSVNFHFNPNSIRMGKNDSHVVFSAYNSSNVSMLSLEFRRSGSGYQMRSGTLNDRNRWVYTTWVVLSNGWNDISLDWQASAGPGQNNGSLVLTVGSVSVRSTALDNDLNKIDWAALGAIQSMDTSTRGTYYFDAFESHR